MTSEDETKQGRPDATKAERTVSQQAKQRPDDEPQERGKPDEGTWPGDLTSENDGGSQG